MFFRQNDLTPKELIDMGRTDRKRLEDLINDHITRMESEGKSPGYIVDVLEGVKSWFVDNAS